MEIEARRNNFVVYPLPPHRYADRMELREFAEQVLFATSLEEKLRAPGDLTDEHPGPPLVTPAAPGRPILPMSQRDTAMRNLVSPGLFATLGMQLNRGRDFDEDDQGVGGGRWPSGASGIGWGRATFPQLRRRNRVLKATRHLQPNPIP